MPKLYGTVVTFVHMRMANNCDFTIELTKICNSIDRDILRNMEKLI